MAASPAPRRLLAVLTVLYLAQGVPHGYFGGALPLWLREEKLPLSLITLSSLLFLPWALKPLWAPLVDRYAIPRLGRRRSWMLPAQAVSVVGLLALAAAGADALRPGLLIATILLVNFAVATQDVAVDAFAVERLDDTSRGLGNAAQTAGYRLGMLAGGGVALQVAGSLGWGASLVFVAAIQALTLGVSAFVREPPCPAISPPAPRGGFGRLPWALLLFVGSSKVAAAMAANLHRLWLFDAGFSKNELGFWLGTVGVALAILGSVGGGLALLRAPLRGFLLVTGIAHAALMGLVAVTALHPGWLGLAAVLAEEATGAFFTVGVFSLMMGRVDRAAPAAGYALLASLEVTTKLVFGALAGVLAEHLGYPAFFAACAVLALPPLALLRRL